MKFKEGKKYVVASPGQYIMHSTEYNPSHPHILEKIFLDRKDKLTYRKGKIYNNDEYYVEVKETDYGTNFVPYYSDEEIKHYNESIEKFAPMFLQGMPKHEDIKYLNDPDIPDENKNYYLQAAANASYLFAKALADKLRDEEII